MISRSLTALLLCAILVPLSNTVSAVEGYYRWPTAFAGTLVFSAEGDLWRLDSGAAQAIRLTSHDELESNPVISPDGERIAFVASFDGIPQLYVMPLIGGAPKQVTFESVGVELSQWAPDGRLLYTSRNMQGATRVRELRLVNPETAEVERIPLRYASTGTFDNSGDTLFFTRHGVSTVSDNARLYRGGGMSQLWRFELGRNREAIRLAEDFAGPIETPMYFDGRIYFISDESGYDNIWSMGPSGNDIRQHSDFSGWRLRGASLRDGVVHYQRGADIYAYDIEANSEQKIDITLVSDRDRTRLRWIDDPLNYMSDARLGGDGERVAITARGRVVLASADSERRVELPVGLNARARGAVPGANGDWVYTIVDTDERGEIWRFASNGSGSGEQLTFDANDHRWELILSPDGKWLIHHDKSSRLWKLNLETGDNSEIMQNLSTIDNDYGSFSFSPSGRYVAFHTSGNRRDSRVVMVHDLLAGDTAQVTGNKYRSSSPAFSRSGDWLYFLSERNFDTSPRSPWGDRNLGSEFDKRTLLFALPLTADSVFPFSKPDELSPNQPNEESDSEASAMVSIDWQEASQRLFQLPIDAGNYSGLAAGEDRLFLIEQGDGNPLLRSFPIDHDDPKLSTFAENVAQFELSNDASEVFYRTRGNSPTLAIVPVGEKAPEDTADFKVRTQGWRLALVPAREWEQMFLDAWRLHRDFAFDETLRGVNWNGVRDRLLPLATRIGHRSDLNDLLGQMASEIGILHSQTRPGDQPEDEEKASVASLGARYGQHPRGVEIVHIYQGEKERPETMGPLSQPDDDIAVGDVITAINNRPITGRAELERELLNQSGEQVLLTTLREENTIQNVVTPITTGAETGLRYLDWTGENEQKVAEAADGSIGYLHLRAMGAGDVESFARDFFPLVHHDGIIVDVRDNSGGNVDSWIIQQFLRKAWAFWQREPGTPVYTNMQNTFRGHLAVLVNAGTYSDGETFAAGIKALELGTLIGERTAGAGIWLADRNRLTDGGMSRVAELPQYGLDGRWLIEGEGITPDIQVVAEPNALFKGNDQQLSAAIEFLLDKIRSEPIQKLVPVTLPPMGERGRDIEPLN